MGWWLIHLLNPWLVVLVTSSCLRDEEIARHSYVERLFIQLLTLPLLGAMLYALWLGAHKLVFWVRDDTFTLASYFAITPSLFDLLPYGLGLAILLTANAAACASRKKLKVVLQALVAVMFLAGAHLVLAHYFQWLAVN